MKKITQTTNNQFSTCIKKKLLKDLNGVIKGERERESLTQMHR